MNEFLHIGFDSYVNVFKVILISGVYIKLKFHIITPWVYYSIKTAINQRLAVVYHQFR